MMDPQTPQKHVIVVEIDKSMAFVLRYNLETIGYRVTIQAGGIAAAEQVEQGDVDLVTFDLTHPWPTASLLLTT